jgi:hypothetical protein
MHHSKSLSFMATLILGLAVSVSAMAVDGDNDGRQAKHVLFNQCRWHACSRSCELCRCTSQFDSRPAERSWQDLYECNHFAAFRLFSGVAGLVTGGSPAPVLQIAAGNVFYPSFWGFQSRLAPAVTNYM